jgi:hypothetical protein
VKLLALGLAVGALALLIAGLGMIVKGRVGRGVVVGVLALVIGGTAASLAAYA